MRAILATVSAVVLLGDTTVTAEQIYSEHQANMLSRPESESQEKIGQDQNSIASVQRDVSSQMEIESEISSGQSLIGLHTIQEDHDALLRSSQNIENEGFDWDF